MTLQVRIGELPASGPSCLAREEILRVQLQLRERRRRRFYLKCASSLEYILVDKVKQKRTVPAHTLSSLTTTPTLPLGLQLTYATGEHIVRCFSSLGR